jgi:hypothetical protein
MSQVAQIANVHAIFLTLGQSTLPGETDFANGLPTIRKL